MLPSAFAHRVVAWFGCFGTDPIRRCFVLQYIEQGQVFGRGRRYWRVTKTAHKELHLPQPDSFEQRRLLTEAMSRLSRARSIGELVDVLRTSARSIAGADGITVIRREGDRVAYIAEDALQPLWAGHDFPIENCISGLAIIEARPIHIPDIYDDPRVPVEAYEPTFVRSMAMYPIGLMGPSMAMGAYWASSGEIDPGASALLASLARYAGVTLGRVTEGRGADPA